MPKAVFRLAELRRRLKNAYPDAHCELVHHSPLELLVATILSAQCTDARVNLVTPSLFKAFPSARALAEAPLPRLETLIRSTGFFRNKARSIKGACARLVEEFGGEVPDRMEDLLRLPGVARKTANVILGTAFGKADGVVVDTHVSRVSRRLGLATAVQPDKIEQKLMTLFPRDEWIPLSHQLIWHGRRLCKALTPLCGKCPLEELCPSSTADASKKRGGRRRGGSTPASGARGAFRTGTRSR